MSRNLLLASLSTVIVLPSIVLAEPAAEPYVDTLTMDTQTPGSKVDIDVGFEVWDKPAGYNKITVFGLTLGGQYMTPGGLGGYVALPLSYLDVDYALGPFRVNDSEFSLGNIEGGVAYAKRFAGNTSLVVHGGIALPTADDDGPGASQGLASVPRYGDVVQRTPNSTWLRLGVSPMGRSGVLFWRADVGLDLALDHDDASDFSPVFRINAGGGVDLGTVQLLGELVTNIFNNANNNADDSASTIAVGARFVSGNLRPGIGLMFPLGFDNNAIQDNLNFVVVASLAIHLPAR